MKHTKLLFMAAAALFASSAMAADFMPTSVYKVGNASTLGSKWTDKGQKNSYFTKGDTVVFCAFLSYQSAASGYQEWIGVSGSGSTSTTWDAISCFVGNSAWGTGDASKKVSCVNNSRKTYYRVTNCVSVLALVNATADKKGVVVKAYEITSSGVASEPTGSDQVTGNKISILSLKDLDATKTYEIQVTGTSKDNSYFYEIAFVAPAAAKNDATLKSITIDGTPLADFDPTKVEYNVELSYGTTKVPTVEATANSKKANAVVADATTLPGVTTINVTAEDSMTTKEYKVNFTVAEGKSTDATLKEITVGGKALSDFTTDKYDYIDTIEYAADYKVDATATDATATLNITQISAFGDKATIEVTAQDGTTKLTYSVTIYQAAAPKKLYEVVFSNGAKGAISTETADNYTVTVPYLFAEVVPTVVSDSVEGKGATATVSTDGKSIVLTGADGVTETYAIQTVALTVPTSLGSDTVTFTGEETDYIFAPYGFGTYSKTSDKVDYKGWKFAKAVNEDSNRRISKGNTRIYMALPAAKEVALVSGTGAERPVKIYVNGKESNVNKTAEYGKAITIALDSTKVNFLAIESNQTSGDGGFIKIMITPAQSTAIDNTSSEVKAVKVLRNGQLLIQKGDKLYTAQGTVVE